MIAMRDYPCGPGARCSQRCGEGSAVVKSLHEDVARCAGVDPSHSTELSPWPPPQPVTLWSHVIFQILIGCSVRARALSVPFLVHCKLRHRQA
jgi:hypothetical protein